VAAVENTGNSTGPAPPVEDPQAEPLSEFDRLIGVLFEPGETFKDVVARPARWWVPLLILTLLGLTFLLVFEQRVGWEIFFRQQFDTNPRLQTMSLEQQERILERQLGFSDYSLVVGILSWTLITLLLAAILLFVFNILMGQHMDFSAVYSVTCYGLLPYVFFYLAALVTMFLKEPRDFYLDHPIASNLGIFLNPAADPLWLVSLASSVDFFNLWCLVLFASGMAAAGRRLAWGRAFGWVLGASAVFLLLRSGVFWVFT